MADLSDVHDPTGGEVAEGRGGAMPRGNYVLAMAKNDRKFTRAGGGDWMLECEFEVRGDVNTGKHAGRRVWEDFNLQNRSPQAMEIAWRNFNALCQACGKLPSTVKNADDLLGIPFVGYLNIDKNNDQRNKITSYKPLNGPTPAAQSQQSSAGGTAGPRGQPAARSNVPAWRQPQR